MLVHRRLLRLGWDVSPSQVTPPPDGMLVLSRLLPPPPGWDASPSQVTPQHSVRLPQHFVNTCLFSWVERGAVGVKGETLNYKMVAMDNF